MEGFISLRKIPVTKTSVRKHTVIAGTQPTKRNLWYGMVCATFRPEFISLRKNPGNKNVG